MASSETLTSMISRPFSSTFEESQGLSFEHDDVRVRPQSEVFGEESKDQVIGFHLPPKKVQLRLIKHLPNQMFKYRK